LIKHSVNFSASSWERIVSSMGQTKLPSLIVDFFFQDFSQRGQTIFSFFNSTKIPSVFAGK